ncbi:hypothetical protein COCCADRAFT_111405 [Bipolaris zeicola 26-R-13]|uniref:Protein kinase domain-containing protein n=1 Tax=Cochliobolus carbonum (strain 26-R-13) TaxID=930089 RepID=W6XK10_COCC2|nr:uncharacterized protein COCCADRAFT_111405 [Bipolaris zeicola 26-R-13]EUC27542.1 hypothetical protein COCCADRAFT_111405 [Bipolaris zeicola 26-R-13]
MASNSIGEAFQRLPRPQVPTAVALMERSLKKAKQPAASVLHNPWETLSHLGDLTQGKQKLSLCLQGGHLVIIKEVNPDTGKTELEKVKTISDHPHVATIKRVFESRTSLLFQYDYTRFTLEEVLNVHTFLKEPDIQVIASAVFLAIQHIAKAGIVHNSVSISTIRLCGRSGKPQLSDFENCAWVSTELTPNADLEQLGITILECMNGLPNENLRDLSMIRQKRDTNKMFGLSKGEQWSGYKLLVDFLDSMFNEEVPALAKLEKPHRYIVRNPDFSSLIPFLELVPLECLSLWRPSVAKS